MIIKTISDFIVGFFEGLLYTTISLFFIFFIKRWYFNYINRNLIKNDYFIKSKAYDRYNPFGKSDIKGDISIRIVNFNSDLRLVVKNGKDIKIITIRKYLIPFRLYWDIYFRILRNNLLCKDIMREGKSKSIFMIKSSNKLENLLDDEFSLLENN